MIGQATCQSRCQVLFPLSAQVVMGPTEVGGTANKPHPSEPSISTEWEACRHRRVTLASRSRNVPVIRSLQEVLKTLPLFLSRREAGGLVPPDRCRHPTNHFDHMLALGPFDTRADEQTWQCQKPTPSFSSMAKSFFAKHASHTLGRGSPPISHHEQFEHRQATLLHQMEQGIGQMAISMRLPQLRRATSAS